MLFTYVLFESQRSYSLIEFIFFHFMHDVNIFRGHGKMPERILKRARRHAVLCLVYKQGRAGGMFLNHSDARIK